MFIDLELNGDIQLSLNLHDSLLFMKKFIQKIKEKKCTMWYSLSNRLLQAPSDLYALGAFLWSYL